MQTSRLGAVAFMALVLFGASAAAQDAGRGQRLFADTPKATGKNVAACATCHSDVGALRAMLSNQGVRVDDAQVLARWLQAVLDGAQPNARNAKAQFQGVLTPQDVRDLAAYIASAKSASIDGRLVVAAAH